MRWRLSPSFQLPKVRALRWTTPTKFSPLVATREGMDDAKYRTFRRQLLQSSLAEILTTLRPGMTEPQVVSCPDGHYRRAIFRLGPYLADYPEQAILANIVSGWCPK